jgi:predicted MFS family arabinose efflux permease
MAIGHQLTSPPSGAAALAPAASVAGREYGSTVYVRYVLALVWLAMMLRVVDLQIVSVLLESIRREFTVSDTQLGLLSGFAFSVFYGVLGIPVGWFADRANRRNIMAVAVGLWSAMTALCGFAGSFVSLMWTRAGVGVGEAGGTAPAYSMISDLTPPERRATTFAFLSAAVPAGIFTGLVAGGWLNATYGWRSAFLVIGAVGIALALLMRMTIREPERAVSDAGVSRAPFLQVLRELWQVPAYRHFVAASALFTTGAVGSGIWVASFFVRVHSLPLLQVATWLGFIYGVAGIAGSLLGGMLADRLVARSGDVRWHARLAWMATIAILPIATIVYLSEHAWTALALHAIVVLLMHMWMGPTYGTIQTLVGAQRRATAAAVNMLAINLLAYGLGPLLVGAASDLLRDRTGDASLRYAILFVVVASYGWAAVHFFLASRTLAADLRASGAKA